MKIPTKQNGSVNKKCNWEISNSILTTFVYLLILPKTRSLSLQLQ